MKTINVSLIKKEDHSYPIFIGENILDTISPFLLSKKWGNKYLIITDSNVKSIYAEKLNENLKANGLDSYIFAFPAGEQQKTIQTKIDIENFMFENKFGRDSVILALGGGVVGDLSGFTASTFNRGIPYIQIPTTILAQVDSSIGGKTAVDVPYGKNLIGTFYQPKAVFIDPMVLNTLPIEEFYAGLAEVIKHAVIQDKEHFSQLIDLNDKILKKDPETLANVIERNCGIKQRVVEQDEKEGNLRRILNFGHTIGHAIEQLMDFSLLHGECVAIGMLIEAEISKEMGYLKDNDVKDIQNLIESYRLPITIPNNLKAEDIYNSTLLDKKAIQNEPIYAIPDNIGSMLNKNDSYGTKVDKKIVIKAIQKYLV